MLGQEDLAVGLAATSGPQLALQATVLGPDGDGLAGLDVAFHVQTSKGETSATAHTAAAAAIARKCPPRPGRAPSRSRQHNLRGRRPKPARLPEPRRPGQDHHRLGDRRWDGDNPGAKCQRTSQTPLRQPVPFWTSATNAHLIGTTLAAALRARTRAPRASSGWHSHPGYFTATVVSGQVVGHVTDCSSETFTAGESVYETGSKALIRRARRGGHNAGVTGRRRPRRRLPAALPPLPPPDDRRPLALPPGDVDAAA